MFAPIILKRSAHSAEREASALAADGFAAA